MTWKSRASAAAALGGLLDCHNRAAVSKMASSAWHSPFGLSEERTRRSDRPIGQLNNFRNYRSTSVPHSPSAARRRRSITLLSHQSAPTSRPVCGAQVRSHPRIDRAPTPRQHVCLVAIHQCGWSTLRHECARRESASPPPPRTTSRRTPSPQLGPTAWIICHLREVLQQPRHSADTSLAAQTSATASLRFRDAGHVVTLYEKINE